MTELKFETLKPEHAKPLAILQIICFPNTPPEALFSEEEFIQHLDIFPEGTFVALADGEVVGLGAGIFLNFDFDHPQHTMMEFIGGGCYDNHDPDGAYYYGTDISVHPGYRRLGIGKRLYELRKDITRRYNKRGIVAGGVLPGFADYKACLSPLEYVMKVAAGELYDPTLTFQVANGFQVRGVMQDYFPDTRSGSWASLIYWENPDYQP